MAEINLRKAGQIRNALEKRLRELDERTGARVAMNIYEADPLAVLAERREEVLERAALIDGLDERLARLRAAIGGANVESGIDALLARRAMLERRVKRLERLTRDVEPVEPETVLRRLEGRREKGADDDRGYWGRRRTVVETVDVQPLTREDLDRLEDELAEARRELADANDDLLRRNLDITIDVADEDLETIRRERVI